MSHPYRFAPERSFWRKVISEKWDPTRLLDGNLLVAGRDRIASAGSCFAANIVPYLERQGYSYVRTDRIPARFEPLRDNNFSYGKFSAPYGNIYTVRQLLQLLKRALGEFSPHEDRWLEKEGIVDPYRPGLRYKAECNEEFNLLTTQYLGNVLKVFESATVFVFTLGLTEAWVSVVDGAVFPACPGTIAGKYDPRIHKFVNFRVSEIVSDLAEFIVKVRELNSSLRVILTVSPVPLVATGGDKHVLLASCYSKSALRVACEEISDLFPGVWYFPAYEIITGPQAPFEFFEADRREPSKLGIAAVMNALLAHCAPVDREVHPSAPDCTTKSDEGATSASILPSFASAVVDPLTSLSSLVSKVVCEEAASDVGE